MGEGLEPTETIVKECNEEGDSSAELREINSALFSSIKNALAHFAFS